MMMLWCHTTWKDKEYGIPYQCKAPRGELCWVHSILVLTGIVLIIVALNW